MNANARTADTYLAQRVLGASPVQQAAMIMEAGQLWLGRALRAMEQGESPEAIRCLMRVSDVINEAFCRLNHKDGGELVQNLARIYNRWSSEVIAASRAKDQERLKIMSQQMGQLREAWGQLHDKQAMAFHPAPAHAGDLVV